MPTNSKQAMFYMATYYTNHREIGMAAIPKTALDYHGIGERTNYILFGLMVMFGFRFPVLAFLPCLHNLDPEDGTYINRYKFQIVLLLPQSYYNIIFK